MSEQDKQKSRYLRDSEPETIFEAFRKVRRRLFVLILLFWVVVMVVIWIMGVRGWIGEGGVFGAGAWIWYCSALIVGGTHVSVWRCPVCGKFLWLGVSTFRKNCHHCGVQLIK